MVDRIPRSGLTRVGDRLEPDLPSDGSSERRRPDDTDLEVARLGRVECAHIGAHKCSLNEKNNEQRKR